MGMRMRRGSGERWKRSVMLGLILVLEMKGIHRDRDFVCEAFICLKGYWYEDI